MVRDSKVMHNIKHISLATNKNEDPQYIPHLKQMNTILNESRKKSKLSYCYLCNKKCDSFCNSHSIPRFSLSNISESGHLIAGFLGDNSVIPSKKGVANAGTFKLICHECDNTRFQEYENPDIYSDRGNLTSKVLGQITKKIMLQRIAKSHIELQMVSAQFAESKSQEYENFQKFLYFAPYLYNLSLSYNEFQMELKRAVETEQNEGLNRFVLNYYAYLDYVVPYAAQDSIAMVCDLEGKEINDVHNPNEKYRLQNIYMCVFPLEEHSVVIAFTDIKDKRYRRFFKQLSRLAQDEQLAVLNYVLIAYSENIYVSDKLSTSIRNNRKLIETGAISNMFQGENSYSHKEIQEKSKELMDLSKWRDIPNLLSREYSISVGE